MRHDTTEFASDEELGSLYAFLFKNFGTAQAHPNATATKFVTAFIRVIRIITIINY